MFVYPLRRGLFLQCRETGLFEGAAEVRAAAHAKEENNDNKKILPYHGRFALS